MSSTSTPFVLKHKEELKSLQIGRRKYIKMIGEESAKTNHIVKIIDNRIKFLSSIIQQTRQMNSDHYILRLNKSLPDFKVMLGLEDVPHQRRGNMVAFFLEDCIVTYSYHNSRVDEQTNPNELNVSIIGDKLKVKLSNLKNESIKSFTKTFTTTMSYSYFKTIVGLNYQLYTVFIIPFEESKINVR